MRMNKRRSAAGFFALLPACLSLLFAVAGDPLKDIAELENVRFVMKGGAVVKNELTQRGGTAAAAGATSK